MDKHEMPPRDYSRLGLIVFIIAVALTVILIAMGIAGIPWPRWLLAVTSLL